MLILTRPVGTSVLIGENTEVKVLGIDDRNHVKIGIDAPDDVPIVRKELKNKSPRKGQ